MARCTAQHTGGGKTRAVVDFICRKVRGGRFLKKVDDRWTAVTDPEEARKKVSHGFRAPAKIDVPDGMEIGEYHHSSGLTLRVPI